MVTGGHPSIGNVYFAFGPSLVAWMKSSAALAVSPVFL